MNFFLNKYSPLKKIIDLFVLKLAKENKKTHTPIALISGDYISSKVILDGRFEIEYLEALSRQIFPYIDNKICIDAGANIGNHSVFFSKYFNKVYAIEPNKKPLDILKVNADWNGNIKIFPFAVSNKKGVGQMLQNQSNIGASKVVVSDDDNKNLQIKIELMDDLVPKSEHSIIGFIKLDVEGHEYEAMLGAKQIIVKSKPIIAFELLRGDYDVKFQKIRDFLHLNGYDRFMIYRFGKFRNAKNLSKKNYKMILALPKSYNQNNSNR